MLALILSILGLGGGLGVLAYFLGPTTLLTFARSAFGFLAKIPWQVWLAAAGISLLAFLLISRGHWMERARSDEAREQLVCQAVREVAGRPRQDCRFNELQIRAFGKSIAAVEGALADQSAHIRELGRRNAELQASLVAAKRQAAARAGQAETVAERADRSARVAPAQPCAVSKVLEEQWK